MSGAHPRSRGENVVSVPGLGSPPGSSPLTRGKPKPHRPPLPYAGLIPAHAGKTGREATPNAPAWAHPRSRGENSVSCKPMRSRSGSSPLTRGKPHPMRRTLGTRRLIPAHAGKTSGVSSTRAIFRAHPRSRGENRRRLDGTGAAMGSSPLTRGKPETQAKEATIRGLIPAHAGKTPSAACRSR